MECVSTNYRHSIQRWYCKTATSRLIKPFENHVSFDGTEELMRLMCVCIRKNHLFLAKNWKVPFRWLNWTYVSKIHFNESHIQYSWKHIQYCWNHVRIWDLALTINSTNVNRHWTPIPTSSPTNPTIYTLIHFFISYIKTIYFFVNKAMNSHHRCWY